MDFKKSNEEFIKNILMKVGFNDNKDMSLLVTQTLTIFNDWIQSEILTALSDQQMENLDKIVSGASSDADIYNFFVASIGDFDQFMDGLYSKFEKMYIEKHKKALNK